MFEKQRSTVLALLKVPPEPHPPAGRPESVRIFRAAPNFYRLRLASWAIGQSFALVGIIFWIGVFTVGRAKWREQRALAANAPVPVNAPATNEVSAGETAAGDPDRSAADRRERRRKARKREPFPIQAGRMADKLPEWALPAYFTLEALGIVFFVGQAFVSYAVLRFDYEQRWYVVTDRSLRIRSGVWRVRESTMSFVNLQQVVVSQGPLQRLLGLADVRVESAGGGGAQQGPHTNHQSLHMGHFHGVNNAEEIRDLILDRLRQFRASGLGDPDEAPGGDSPSMPAVPPQGLEDLAAARDVLAAARELRATLESVRSGR